MLRPARLCFAAAFSCVLLLIGCASPDASDAPSAAAVIDSAVVAHGGDVLDRAVVTFTFRGADFRVRRNDGAFRYERTGTDSTGRVVRDVLTNDSLYRTVDGSPVDLSDDERSGVLTAVNSVTYFALLPYFLQDPAVQPAYQGRDTIDGQSYHRIRVTFRREGGGPDYEDVYVYWFRTDTYAMDYLAYAFGMGNPDEEVGTRFREAYDVRRIEGVRFADYRNYVAEGIGPDAMDRYPDLFMQDSLRLVSTVETDSVTVSPLGDSPLRR